MSKAFPEARASTKDWTSPIPTYQRKIQQTKVADSPMPVIKVRERDWIFCACATPPPALSIALEAAGLVASAALTLMDTSSVISPSWVARLTPLALGVAAYGAFHTNIYLLGVPTPRQLELNASLRAEAQESKPTQENKPIQDSKPTRESEPTQDSEQAHDSDTAQDSESTYDSDSDQDSESKEASLD